MKILFSYLIFPGFLFSVLVGLVLSGIERKITARIQWRKGPVWYQGFLDMIKLINKEVILPSQKNFIFLIAPILGLTGVVLVAAILGNIWIDYQKYFIPDLIILVYLLLFPSLGLILGGSASANPLASIGVSREIKLLFAYELPFILAILGIVIKTGSIALKDILVYQINYGSNISSLSGFLAFLVVLICSQAKLGLVPFDVSEAEQEIMSGVLIEYSGLLLAIFKLTKAILLYIMPLFLIILFIGRDTGILFLVTKFLVLFLIMVLIKNTTVRLRIDQILRFFWGPVTFIALLSVILALLGW